MIKNKVLGEKKNEVRLASNQPLIIANIDRGLPIENGAISREFLMNF